MLTLEQKLQVWAICGYEPYKEQLDAHAFTGRVKLAAGGERAGKSRWAAGEVTVMLVPDPEQLRRGDLRPVRVAVAADSYDESHKEMSYVIDDMKALGLLKGEPSTPKQGKWIVETTAEGYVETVSMKDGGKELTGRGEPYDLVAIVEAGRVKEECYTDARLRVAETRGLVDLSGTIWEEFGWYAELWNLLRGPNDLEGRSFSIPTWANTKVFPGGFEDPEIQRLKGQMPEDEFWRRLGARIVPSPARIYREFDRGLHVQDVPFDPDLPVDLTVDAGYFPSKYAVLAIQPRLADLYDHDPEEPENDADVREVLFVLDEIWEQNLVHQQVIELCKEREWWPNVRRIWIGHEGIQHAAAESTEEVWRRETGKPTRICRRVTPKYHTFMRVRTFLMDPLRQVPRLYIDRKCQGLAHEFERLERRTNRFHKVISDDPPADAEDDALDALGNYVVERFGLAAKMTVTGRPGRRSRPARG